MEPEGVLGKADDSNVLIGVLLKRYIRWYLSDSRGALRLFSAVGVHPAFHAYPRGGERWGR